MNENDYIILPTYNERSNIGDLIFEILKRHQDVKILVVDDNSPDGTALEVKKIQKKYKNVLLLERREKEGLGRAYIDAFKMVLDRNNVRCLVMMDADFSHKPESLAEMFRLINEYDLIIGSRYTRGGRIESWELWRRLLSWGGNVYCRIILRHPVSDWTTGYNCIKADVLRRVDLKKLDISGYAFIIEIKYHLIKAAANVMEIPISFGSRRGGESKLSNHIVREGVMTPWKLILTK